MKYQFMQKHEKEFKLERMSRVLGVSRSGYYRFIKAPLSQRAQQAKQLLPKIKAAYQSNRCVYGSPRICKELRAQGEVCSRKRVAWLMQQRVLSLR
jgi:putative transposase